MAETSRDILINLIGKQQGFENWNNVGTTIKKVGEAAKQVESNFEKVEGRFKQVAKVTAGYDKDNNTFIKTAERMIPLSKEQIALEKNRSKVINQVNAQDNPRGRLEIERALNKSIKESQRSEIEWEKIGWGAQKKYNKAQEKSLQNQEKQRKSLKKQSGQIKKIGEDLSSFSVTLPLLFGFQSISKGMESLIDPAMEMFGVTKTYNDFLALKYMPTALEQLDKVLETGEAWLDLSEAQKLNEGNTLLQIKQISDLVTYTAQWAQIMAAVGEIIPVVGRSGGALAGTLFALGTSTAALANDQGNLIATMSGFEAAIGVGAVDAFEKLQDKINSWSNDAIDKNVVDTKREVDDLVDSWDLLSEQEKITLMVDLKTTDTNLFDYLTNKLDKEGLDSPNISGKTGSGGQATIPTSTPDVKAKKPFFETTFGSIIGTSINLGGNIADIFFKDKPKPLVTTKWNKEQPILEAAVGRQNVQETGLYRLHQGETVLRKDQAQSSEQQININYNITASSMKEFESMLRESERRLTSDIRRQTR